MNTPDAAAPLAVQDAERLHPIREAFAAAGFTASELARRLKVSDVLIPRRDVPRLLPLCPPDAFGTLARLFVLGLAASTDELPQTLGEDLTNDLVAVGLIGEPLAGSVVSAFSLSVFDHLLLLQEAPWNPPTFGLQAQVMFVSGSTRTTAQMAITRPCESVLEIGTGCGLLAVLQAAHASRVVATDCNSRALNLAAFTARLNGHDNIEYRLGDLFEPVAGEQFDRIVTNPPYVLTPPPSVPEARVMYRDSGLPADGLSEAVVRGLPRHLKPGGFGQSMINWACVKGQDWKERLQGWLQENDCDAWLLRFETVTPEQYATTWVPKMPESEFPRFLQTFQHWMAYYEREKIEAIGAGFITLRRRSGGPNWFAEDAAPEQRGPCGEAILRGFAARDYLTQLRSEEDLLGTTFRLAPETRWARTFQPADAGWAQAGSRIVLSTGLAFSLDVGATGMNVVTRCRGDRPLRAVLQDVATELEQDVGAVAKAALLLIQTMIEQGFLLPPDA